MINKQFKLENKIPNSSKVVAITRNQTKFLSFKANLTLRVKVTGEVLSLSHSQGITQNF